MLLKSRIVVIYTSERVNYGLCPTNPLLRSRNEMNMSDLAPVIVITHRHQFQAIDATAELSTICLSIISSVDQILH